MNRMVSPSRSPVKDAEPIALLLPRCYRARRQFLNPLFSTGTLGSACPAGSNFLLPGLSSKSMRTTKISIAIDREKLRLARDAARSERMSLSAYIARAVGKQLEDQARLDAARELHRSWGPETIPTSRERDEFLTRMSRPRKRRRRAA